MIPLPYRNSDRWFLGPSGSKNHPPKDVFRRHICLLMTECGLLGECEERIKICGKMHQCEEKDVYLQKIGIYDKRD